VATNIHGFVSGHDFSRAVKAANDQAPEVRAYS
jgi:hypothetical protein